MAVSDLTVSEETESDAEPGAEEAGAEETGAEGSVTIDLLAPTGDLSAEDDAVDVEAMDSAAVPEVESDGIAEEVEHEVAEGSGETVLHDFRPGEDHVTLRIGDGGEGEFIVEAAHDADGAEIGVSLSYATEEDETTVTFIGMSDLPFGDISVEITDPETGELRLYSLAELGDFGALAPNDPDLPDLPGPAGSDGEEVLQVNDPDVPDDPVPGGEEDIVLPPQTDMDMSLRAATGEARLFELGDGGETLILPDDPMEGGLDATLTGDESGAPAIRTEGTLNIVIGGAGDDTIVTGDAAAIVEGGDGNDMIRGGDGTAILSGGAGDDVIHAGDDTGSHYILSGGGGADALHGGAAADTILMDISDTASGGAGADLFRLGLEPGNAAGHAEITDFTRGEDLLRITLAPEEEGQPAPTVEVVQSEDGTASGVVVNGQLVAVLRGAPNVTADDIVVEVGPVPLG
ncbi:putative Ig domain-containing protein,putative calcium-binding protein [Celeribacter indicus]|uniref:Putative Ig domain-containing protein,putative calcium-binding protein n=1 Tax=Celeribacter indicus TaxID=1208324 RepID=A0A0B5DVF6_9RHOB|nr:putative Ig domain-containing protein,putative calcium-binding protein [Celeribacter indicus]